MSTSSIIDDNMTLEEKLDAIAQAMDRTQFEANEVAMKKGEIAAPIDPADLTMCEGCQ